jgi:GAF domain-containing protein
MPIDPVHLARSLGEMSSLDVEQGLAGALRQVLGSAKTLFDADMTGLMLVDHAGALRLASAAAIEDVAGDPDRLGQGPCCIAFTQRVPVAVRDLSAEPGRRALVQVGLDAASRGALSVPVQVAGGPVGTLDVYVTAPRDWDDSEAAALQAYAGMVASLLTAATTARVTGRLADQLQAALAHRLLIEQAVRIVVDREGLDAPAALEWLATAARSSGSTLVQVARDVVGGAPLPSDRLAQAKAQRRDASDPRGCGARPGFGAA